MNVRNYATSFLLVLAACGDNKTATNNRDAAPADDGGPDAEPCASGETVGLLAVWSDHRIDTRNPDIFATRVAPDGTVLDKKSFVVNADANAQRTPVVARVGNRYVVAWNNNNDIAAAAVGDDNTVTQMPAIAATAATESVPSIAAEGETAVLVWQSAADIQAAVMTGTTFGAPISIAATAAGEVTPAVAASPMGFLVVWSDDTHVRGQRLTAAGALDGGPIQIVAAPGASAKPSVAFNGTDYVVIYNLTANLFGTRVSTTGNVLNPTPKPITMSPSTTFDSSVSCDAASCLVTYADNRAIGSSGFDVYAQRVAFDLTVMGGEITVQTAIRDQVTPAVARTTNGWIALWEDLRTGSTSLVMGTPITGTGTVSSATGTPFSTSIASEQDVAIADTGTQQLIIWSDSRVVGNDIMGTRFDGIAGGKLDATAKQLTSGAADQSTPAVSYDGTNYVAIWTDARGATRDLYATRFTTAGAALDTTNIAVSTASGDQLLPDIASGGGVSLAVWMDRRNGNFDIYGAIIDGGTVTVADIAISTDLAEQNAPAVAFDPTSGNFIVVWRSDQLGGADIFGARVTAAGAVLDANGVRLSTSTASEITPDIAVSGSVIMTVWDDRRNDSFGDIYGSRLAITGGNLIALDPVGILINAATNRQNFPTIIGLATSRFMVAWTDSRAFATLGTDIYGVELSSMGVPANTSGNAIANTAGNQAGPAFAVGPNTNNRVAIAYQHYRADQYTTRAFRRRLTVAPATTPVLEPEEEVDAPVDGVTGQAATAPDIARNVCR